MTALRSPLLFAAILLLSASARAQTRPVETRPAETQPSWWDTNFQVEGSLSQETAYRVAEPQNFSKLKEMIKLDLKFIFNEHFKLKVGGRAWVDGVYDLTDQYPDPVVTNMRAEALPRDVYLDITYPNVSLRIGHQQIVWGEALGQFFADVVTPKDLREFFLPSFDYIRLPIWALDAQFTFLPGTNLELVASPDRTVDKIALQGADFAPRISDIPGFEEVLLPDNRPDTDFKSWNLGGRLATLVSGWDLAWFYYTGPALLPALSKTASADPVTGAPQLLLDPIHERVHHGAMTYSKGFGETVVSRGEFVYTHGNLFNSKTPTVDRGLEQKDQFRYVLGLDIDFGKNVLFNGEFQQEAILGSTSNVADEVIHSWVFLRVSADLLNHKLIPELITIVGLDGGDTEISPRLSYRVINSVTFTWGADVFSGPNDQLYGQFDGQDRIFMNTEWKF